MKDKAVASMDRADKVGIGVVFAFVAFVFLSMANGKDTVGYVLGYVLGIVLAVGVLLGLVFLIGKVWKKSQE